MNIVKKIIFLSFLFAAYIHTHAQCNMQNTALKSNEYLTYNLYFNWKFVWVKVGSAAMSVVQSQYKGQPCYRASLLTRGNNRADHLFILRDTLQAYTSIHLAPMYYRKAAHEGERYYIDEVFYTYPNHQVHVKQHQITNSGEHIWKQGYKKECVYDMLNIFLRARSFNPSNWKKGHIYRFTMIDGEKTTPAILKFQGKTVVKADNNKKYNCLQLSYMEKTDGGYKRIVDFFVTDDVQHIPVRIDMFLNFGSAKAFLVGMKGAR